MSVTTAKIGKAARGAYGAKPFDPVDDLAATLLEAIRQELGDCDFFTREDLLHTAAFGWCATITRYAYVREAVTRLLDQGKLVAPSRTELTFPAKLQAYHDPAELAAEFAGTVRRLAFAAGRKFESFGVPEILTAWKSDPHIAPHVKRVTIRQALRAMARDGEIDRVGPNLYAMDSGA